MAAEGKGDGILQPHSVGFTRAHSLSAHYLYLYEPAVEPNEANCVVVAAKCAKYLAIGTGAWICGEIARVGAPSIKFIRRYPHEGTCRKKLLKSLATTAFNRFLASFSGSSTRLRNWLDPESINRQKELRNWWLAKVSGGAVRDGSDHKRLH